MEVKQILLVTIVFIAFCLFIKKFYFNAVQYRYKIVSKKTGREFSKTNDYDDAQRRVAFYSNLDPEDLIDIEENEDYDGNLNLTT